MPEETQPEPGSYEAMGITEEEYNEGREDDIISPQEQRRRTMQWLLPLGYVVEYYRRPWHYSYPDMWLAKTPDRLLLGRKDDPAAIYFHSPEEAWARCAEVETEREQRRDRETRNLEAGLSADGQNYFETTGKDNL
jgi:hypothetical protein